jgi:hypothetical protein
MTDGWYVDGSAVGRIVGPSVGEFEGLIVEG